MTRMRVQLDEPRCVTSGSCVLTAPEVFAQRDQDGVAVLLTHFPATELYEKVREAATGCPAAAIRLSRR